MKENIKKVHRIEIDKNGTLTLQKYVYEDKSKTVPCPFNKEKLCGTWCIHFGDVTNEAGGYDYYTDDYDSYYQLKLSCGCGVIIKAPYCNDYAD